MKEQKEKLKIKIDGKYISPEKIFTKAERLLYGKSDKYMYSVLPLADKYNEGGYPQNTLMFAVGILVGIILEKKKAKIECEIPLRKFDTLFQLLKRFKEEMFGVN